MSSDERAAMQMLGSSSSISPERVTNQVLKICNVVREKLDVHGEGQRFMRKRSGLGGTGGRRLSPDLRIHFGTFGFKKGDKLRSGSMTAPHTIQSPSGQRGHTSFQPRRGGGGSQIDATMLETNDSTNGPPDMRNSVDLGMHNDESTVPTSVSCRGRYNRLKKKVVLRKPGDSQQ